MLELIKKIIFSSRTLALLLFVFTFSIGLATFIENDYGTPASKMLIYNTHWFELVILLLGVNLVGSIVKYKLYRKKKLPVFLFHVAWIVIVIGAGVTRYYGFEGSMHIKEGQSEDRMVSQRTFIQFRLDDKVKQLVIDKPVLMNGYRNDHFDYDLEFQGKKINIKYLDFLTNAVDSVVEVDNGKDIIELVTVGKNGRKSVFLAKGETQMFGPFPISYDAVETSSMAIKIKSSENGLMVLSPYDMNYLKMDDQSQGMITRDSLQPFEQRRLYVIGDTRIVYKTKFTNGELRKVAMEKDKATGEDVLKVAVSSGSEEKILFLPGGQGYVSPKTMTTINGLNFMGSYGAKFYPLPFSLKLNEFQLETYPGTSSPSSYASEVTLIDESKNISENHRIYMNHVLDYGGYRFFQSSYDEDMKGTVLSVNHDLAGTVITYIGYVLLALGMILTFIGRNTRFNSLRKKLAKLKAKRLKSLAMILVLIVSVPTLAVDQERIEIPLEHIQKFDKLIVQGSDGRFMPIQSYTSQLARKITSSKKYKGLTASQFIFGMIYDRAYWQGQKIIKLEHPVLAEEFDAEVEKIGMSDMYYVSFEQMFDDKVGYILAEKVKAANRKPMAERTMYDKELIKLDERINVAFLIFEEGAIFKLFPHPDNPDGGWYSNSQADEFSDTTQLFVKHIMPLYMSTVQESFDANDWKGADKTLGFIADYQVKFGHHVLPAPEIINLELTYNKYNFFNRSMGLYLLVGFLLLFFSFLDIFYRHRLIGIIQWGLIIILAATFVFHGIGLGIRWKISGHAPWSNAYEALTYIAWGTIFAGFLFVKSSRITMAATAILAGMTLFVAWLNWLNPEITNLQPVLKSYWLTIHVAIITSSYSFLGLAAILGLNNLILMVFRTEKNKEKLGDAIDELTYISEMTMTIGVFAAAIGTFLGGVWANESWGRYWGWDPKETWALVVVMTYVIVLHLRLVPGWRGKYLFNVTSLYAYGTVLMTFFGVNYYLSGLHSYAGGTAPPVPSFVLPTVILFVVVSVVAYFRSRRFS